MNKHHSGDRARAALTRRQFVQGLAAGGALLGTAGWSRRSWAGTGATDAPVLRDTDLALTIGETPVNFTGRPRPAVTVNGALPAPTLRWREGDTVTLRVANALPPRSVFCDTTSIHWHGLLLPANMDGVPGLSFDGIARGEAYLYRFTLRQSGTYWYHSHSGFQEQAGLYGAIIIDPREPDPIAFDREHVVLLSDWTDLAPAALFARLKTMSDHDNLGKRTVSDFVRDARRDGLRATLADRRAWGEMRMTPTDLSDVNANTYTYLMNGVTGPGNWTGLFRSGERVRLRLINGSAMTHFDVRIPGLTMTVVACDGGNVHPVTVEELRIAAAETVDVIVVPSGQDAFTIFAQDMGRTGSVSGTLAVRHGLRAPVPDVDRRVILTMADMGHGGMHHGGMQHDGMQHADMAAAATGQAAMDHFSMDHAGTQQAAMDHAGMDHAEMDHAAMDHAGMNHGTQAQAVAAQDGMAQAATTRTGMGRARDADAGQGGGMASHPASERGNPLIDMQTMAPAHRLDDPGIGLRNNGRKVLSYAMLRSIVDDPDGREPGREITLHLTGHMEKFAWSFDGQTFSQAAPLRMSYGERLRIVLVNDTMMTHPIHLHGMWSDLEDGDGQFLVRKHTLDMPPGTRRSYRVRADALGSWAYHCHLLYHMEAGMMREVQVQA